MVGVAVRGVAASRGVAAPRGVPDAALRTLTMLDARLLLSPLSLLQESQCSHATSSENRLV